MRTWRLILDGRAEGAWNMAVDRAILHAHETGAVGPTLRLYGWDRPTVSVGRFQQLRDVDAQACAQRGVGWCRRPTGGRGVLHHHELTYSMVAGLRDGIPRGVSASYRVLCGALVEAYRELGVPADLTARSRGARDSGACYLHATDADLSLGAAKLSGSAQVWSGGSCLQHGSFVISRDLALEARVFGLDAADEAALAEGTETIGEFLGRLPGQDELVAAVLRGLERGLDAGFETCDLTAAELSDAEARVAEFRLPTAQPPG